MCELGESKSLCSEVAFIHRGTHPILIGRNGKTKALLANQKICTDQIVWQVISKLEDDYTVSITVLSLYHLGCFLCSLLSPVLGFSSTESKDRTCS